MEPRFAKEILVSPKKAKDAAKAAEIELCYQQREAQIRKYESRNPFSYIEWVKAFINGSLRQKNLGYWSFPSPTAHYRRLWETCDSEWFKSWREESKRKHKKFVRKLRKRRKK